MKLAEQYNSKETDFPPKHPTGSNKHKKTPMDITEKPNELNAHKLD